MAVFRFNNVDAMNILLLSFCHTYPLIILGSIPRSRIADSKAMHVLMCWEGTISSHIHQCRISSVPHSPHLANLIGLKKERKKPVFIFISILKIIGGVEHIGLFRMVLDNKKALIKRELRRKTEGLKGLSHCFTESYEFLRKPFRVP